MKKNYRKPGASNTTFGMKKEKTQNGGQQAHATGQRGFMTIMPLLRQEGFSYEKLAAVVARDYTALGLDVKPLSPGNRSPEDPLLLDIKGCVITIMLVQGQVPAEQFHLALDTNLIWREGPEALQAHRAHIVVAASQAAEGHGQALNIATYVTIVSAALAGMTPCIAVYWSSGDTITHGVRWRERAQALVTKDIPVDLWVQFRFMPGGPSFPESSHACLTTGLQPFVGREIEFRPEPLPPADIFQRVSGMALYLMQQGLVVEDGDSVGANETEIIRVRYADQGIRPGIPILSLTCETTERAV